MTSSTSGERRWPMRWPVALLLLFSLAARTPSLPGQEQAAGASKPSGASAEPRPHSEPLPHSHSLMRAVATGTRSLKGAPGPRYWQQRVDYQIEAEVDFSAAELRGRETITYHNNSPDVIDTVGLRLYQNVMKPEAPRTFAMPATGGVTVGSLRIAGEEISPSDTTRVRVEGGAFVGASGTPEVGTLVWIELPRPIAPGAAEQMDVGWSFRIPADWAPRMGMQDSTTVQMAQWYPQIAVYDDLNGWDRQLYLGTGEFYDEYGDFEVTIRVPPGFVVASTGTLKNPEEVLTREGRKRLERVARAGGRVRILSAEEFGTGKIVAPGVPPSRPGSEREAGAAAETVAWRFEAKDVRDFAFAASDHYQWDATRAVVDSAAGRTATVHAYWRPGQPHADAAVEMAAHAVTFHSAHIAPYIYPQISVSEGGSGGMEYPMIVFVQAYEQTPDIPDPAAREYSLIAHEIGHEWFPMMVGSNETAYGWQDEGVNTFITFWPQEAMDYAPPPRQEIASQVAFFAGSDLEQPLMTHSDAFPVVGPWYRLAAYNKPAMVLLVLRDVLGAETFDRALTEYTRAWTLKHPAPQDFFNAFEKAAGQDLDWFWRPWFYDTAVLDLAVAAVERSPEGRYAVTVLNEGKAPAPVVAEVTLEGGRTERLEAPARALAEGGAVRLPLEDDGMPVEVRLDPDQRYPDVDRSDDAWTAPAQELQSDGRGRSGASEPAPARQRPARELAGQVPGPQPSPASGGEPSHAAGGKASPVRSGR